MEILSSIGNWLSEHEAGISALAGLVAIAVVFFVPLRSLWRRLFDTSPAPGKAADTAAGSSRPSILVLPFDDLSEGQLHPGTVDGFTEDLTTLLARMPGYFVVARNTAFTFRGQNPDVRELGQSLDVRYVLEGSIRTLGDQLRVTAQLIETESGTHLWAEKFERPATDMALTLDEVATVVARQLGGELTRAEAALAARRPADQGAWEYYQQAKSTLMSRGWSESSFDEVARLLRLAIKTDPEFAPPRGYLALILAVGHWVKLVPDRQAAHDEALACADTALELAPNSSEVLGYVGCALSDLGYGQRGVPIIERAIDLDPSNAQAFAALGAAKVIRGDLEAGIAQLEHAVELSPRDAGYAPWSTMLSIGSALLGEQEKSLYWAQSACQSDARYFPSRIAYARAPACAGEVSEAVAALDEAKRMYPDLNRDYVSGFMGEWVVQQLNEAGVVLE